MSRKNNPKTLYITARSEWRKWLEENFETEKEIWLVYPSKSSGKPYLPYNDAVEEAICFGWIDSTIRKLDEEHRIQWFLPRKNKNYYSPLNKERLRRVWEKNLIHPKVKNEVEKFANENFVFPPDIIKELKKEKIVWDNYQQFSESYKRIRIGYIEDVQNYPMEFDKRLLNFINKTRQNKLISGTAGAEKYY